MAILVVGETVWREMIQKNDSEDVKKSRADLEVRYEVRLIADEAYAKILADIAKVTGSAASKPSQDNQRMKTQRR